jgi:ligand-binding SRPBCC domain-containing protein
MPRTFFLRTSQFVARDLETTFAFFADAANLQKLTPPWLDFSITTPQPIAMHEGTLIDYRLKLRGLPIRWRSVISEWNPPHSFVDEQVRGPYTMWRHRHTFTPHRDGTLVADEVRYRVFGGMLANIFVKRDLAMIFAYRWEALLVALDVPRGPQEVAFGTV